MAILVFSDPHFDNHQAFERIEKEDSEFAGCNSRMLVLLRAAQRAYKYAYERGIHTVVVPGDIFHRRGIVPVPVFNAVAKTMERARDEFDIQTFVIPGNHDFVDRHARFADQGLHALYSLAGATVIHEPSIVRNEGGKHWLAFIPYTGDREAWLEAAKLHAKTGAPGQTILFAHQSFDGAKVGPHEYVMREGINPSQVPEGFAALISGHYHLHQTIEGVPNAFYVGGLAQHNFGERDYTPGWLVIDEDTYKVTHVEDTLSPRFKVVTTNSDEAAAEAIVEAAKRDDYLQVRWFGGQDGVAFAEQALHTPGVLWQTMPTEQHHSRMEVSVADPVNELLKKYISHVRGSSPDFGEISEGELLEAGVRFMEEGRRNRSV